MNTEIFEITHPLLEEQFSTGSCCLGDCSHHGWKESLESSGAGDMVSVTVRVNGVFEVKSQLVHILCISLGGLDNRVNQTTAANNHHNEYKCITSAHELLT